VSFFGTHAVTRLPYRIGQSDNGEARQPVGDVDLDGDRAADGTGQGGSGYGGEHVKERSPPLPDTTGTFGGATEVGGQLRDRHQRHQLSWVSRAEFHPDHVSDSKHATSRKIGRCWGSAECPVPARVAQPYPAVSRSSGRPDQRRNFADPRGNRSGIRAVSTTRRSPDAPPWRSRGQRRSPGLDRGGYGPGWRRRARCGHGAYDPNTCSSRPRRTAFRPGH